MKPPELKTQLFFILLLICCYANGQEKIKITETLLYIDSSASESFEKISDSAFQKNFKAIELAYPTGNNAFNFWFKIEIENAEKKNKNIQLVLTPPALWKATSYSGLHYQQIANTGTYYKNSHSPNLPLHLTPGINTVFLNIEGFGGAYGVNFKILKEEIFYEKFNKKTFSLSFFYGIIFMIFLLNIFYWITLKKKAFFYYSIYTFLTILLYSTVDGMPYLNFFGVLGDFAGTNILVGVVLYFGFLPLMSLEFLQISEKYPKIKKVCVYYFFFTILAVISTIIWNSHKANEFHFSYHNFTCFFGVLLVLIITVLGLKEKNILSRSFLIAFIILIVSFILSSMESYGTTDLGGGWQFAQIGSAIEIIILSFALAINFRNTEMSYKKVQQDYSNLEYSFLRTQMNPHFLFNILGSIQNRILKDDKEGALELVDKFSGMVREVVDSSKEEFIPIKQELKFLNNYIALQGKNYGDRFTFQIKIDAAINTEDWLIPNMVLQPFIENVFIHAFPSVSKRDLILEIEFIKEDTYLTCFIKDNGIGLIQKIDTSAKKSIGIQNTRGRLEKLSKKFNQNFSITLSNRNDEQGTAVELHLPFEVD